MEAKAMHAVKAHEFGEMWEGKTGAPMASMWMSCAIFCSCIIAAAIGNGLESIAKEVRANTDEFKGGMSMWAISGRRYFRVWMRDDRVCLGVWFPSEWGDLMRFYIGVETFDKWECRSAFEFNLTLFGFGVLGYYQPKGD